MKPKPNSIASKISVRLLGNKKKTRGEKNCRQCGAGSHKMKAAKQQMNSLDGNGKLLGVSISSPSEVKTRIA
jgi:hypothetical protein